VNRLRTIRGALSYANVMATVAVFIALGGIAGAAIKPLLDKRGAVKGRHVARGAIHMNDLAPSVRTRIVGELPDSGTYTGQAADGTFSVTAVVEGDAIVQMSGAGDCPFAAQSGNFNTIGTSWSFGGLGSEHPLVTGSMGNDEIVVIAVGVAGNICRGPVQLNPV
jgi:hypothetical protein